MSKTWLKQLRAKLSGSSEERSQLTKQLYRELGALLMTVKSEEDFAAALQTFLEHKEFHARDFMKYFKEHWGTSDRVSA